MNKKEERCNELLEKIKRTSDKTIEEAIDSLHAKYIKEAKKYIEYEIKNNRLINGYTDIYIFQTELELLFKYIEDLEQKEATLDKVKEFIKEDITTEDIKVEGSKLFKVVYKDLIDYIKEKIIEGVNSYKKEIENIIEEGEKK